MQRKLKKAMQIFRKKSNANFQKNMKQRKLPRKKATQIPSKVSNANSQKNKQRKLPPKKRNPNLKKNKKKMQT